MSTFSQAEKMTTLIKAAGLDVEPIWPSLFSKALEGKDVGALIMNVGSGAAAAAPAAGMAAGGDKGGEKVEEKKEEKKPESEDESDDDMGFGKSLCSENLSEFERLVVGFS